MGRRLLTLVAGAVVAILAEWGLPLCRGFATPQPPMWPISPEQRRKDQQHAARLRRGEEFVKAILNQPFEILSNHKPPDASGAGEKKEEEQAGAAGVMRLWRDIPDLYTGTPMNIVLRSIVEPFWQSCIDRVEFTDPLWRYRVCAVGTPGTGKSITTPLLLRMLLLKGSAVVYIRRTVDGSSWYYEFIPTSKDDAEIAVTVNVYPEESTLWYNIPSLTSTSNYYVVDPGMTMESCDPDEVFQARVIIVSSNIAKQWGEFEFLERRSGQVGTFRYFPLWNLSEVLHGLDGFYSDDPLTPQQLAERYRNVGGVPGNLFADEELYQNSLVLQDDALQAVELWQLLKLVSGKMDTKVLLNNVPKSAVMGIASADKDDRTFIKRIAVPVSTAVAEKMFSLHIQELWDDMVRNERRLVFGSYLRMVLSTAGSEITVQVIDQGRQTSGRISDRPPSKIGGYGIQIVPSGKSIVKAAIDNPTANILFYSEDPRNQFADFVCKDNAGYILAFQATTSPTHTVDETQIAALEDEVGDRGLMLYYMHPTRSERFTTEPVTPSTRFCWIFHVEIPNSIASAPETGVRPAVAAADPVND